MTKKTPQGPNTIEELDAAFRNPKFAKDLYLFLAKNGQIPAEKQLPVEEVDKFFGVK